MLSPILFVIYTTTLQHLLSSLDVSFHFYADYTKIYFTVSDKQEAEIKTINIYESVSCWIRAMKLKLNPGKTEILLGCGRPTSTPIQSSSKFRVPVKNVNLRSTWCG